MHVLHILMDSGCESAGRGLLTLCAAAAEDGRYIPVAACPGRSQLAEELAERGIKVISLPGSRTWRPGVWRRLSQAENQYDFALIHTHDLDAARLGGRGYKTWGRARWLHTWWTPPVFAKAKSLEKFHPVDMFVNMSQETAAYLQEQGFASWRIRVIPAGIDLAAYPPKHDRRDGRLIFAALGPLVPDSGHAVLLQALAAFKKACPEQAWELRLVGTGCMFDQILQQARDLDISEHMGFLGRQRTVDILPDCDLMLVSDLRGEDGCLAVKEAWAAGLPVICSDLGVHKEMVEDGRNGLLVPAGDAAALAARLIELAGNERLGHSLSEAGFAAVREYSQERVNRAYLDLYERLAPSPRGADRLKE